MSAATKVQPPARKPPRKPRKVGGGAANRWLLAACPGPHVFLPMDIPNRLRCARCQGVYGVKLARAYLSGLAHGQAATAPPKARLEPEPFNLDELFRP